MLPGLMNNVSRRPPRNYVPASDTSQRVCQKWKALNMTHRPSTTSLRRGAKASYNRRLPTESRLAKPGYLFDKLRPRDYSGRRSHWGLAGEIAGYGIEWSYRRAAYTLARVAKHGGQCWFVRFPTAFWLPRSDPGAFGAVAPSRTGSLRFGRQRRLECRG